MDWTHVLECHFYSLNFHFNPSRVSISHRFELQEQFIKSILVRFIRIQHIYFTLPILFQVCFVLYLNFRMNFHLDLLWYSRFIVEGRDWVCSTTSASPFLRIDQYNLARQVIVFDVEDCLRDFRLLCGLHMFCIMYRWPVKFSIRT